MSKGTIYGLCDPRHGIVQYVGSTMQKISLRNCDHIAEAQKPHSNSKKNMWIKWLLSLSLRPRIITLKNNVEEEKLEHTEIHYIIRYKKLCEKLGYEFMNSILPLSGHIFDDNLRTKLREIRSKQISKPLSIITKHKISKQLTGRKLSKEHKEHIGNVVRGRKLSKKHIQQIKNRMRSKEMREKLRVLKTGKKLSVQIKRKISMSMK